MKEAEITGKVAIGMRAVGAVEHPQDQAAARVVAHPFTDYAELALIERIRQQVLYGGRQHTLAEWMSILTEEVGEAARSVNEFLAGERGEFENLQIELVQVGATAAAFFQETAEAAAANVLAHGPDLPHILCETYEPLPVLALPEGMAAADRPASHSIMESKPILAFTGGRGAGKDSVAAHLIRTQKFAKGSFALPLKRLVCNEFGWDLGRMDELAYKEEYMQAVGMTRREMLIKVGTEWFRSVDPLHWIKRSAPDFLDTLQDPTVRGLAVTDLRFENELVELKKAFPLNPIIVVQVRRTDAPLGASPDDAINAWQTIPADLKLAAGFGELPLLYAQIDDFMRIFTPEGQA